MCMYVPVCVCDTFILQNNLREEITEQVRWNVNRDSMEDKQRSLVDLIPALKRDIKHQVRRMEVDIQPINQLLSCIILNTIVETAYS